MLKSFFDFIKGNWLFRSVSVKRGVAGADRSCHSEFHLEYERIGQICSGYRLLLTVE